MQIIRLHPRFSETWTLGSGPSHPWFNKPFHESLRRAQVWEALDSLSVSQTVCALCLVIQPCLSLPPHGLWPVRLLCPRDFSGKNTGVGCHSLLQEIFPTQGLNLHLLCLLHCRWILYPLSHQGSPSQTILVIKKEKKSLSALNKLRFLEPSLQIHPVEIHSALGSEHLL